MALVYPQLVEWMALGKIGMAVNMAVVKVSEQIGGPWLMAIGTAGAVAAVLSTAAGLMITSASTISHDLYKNYINPDATEKQELNIAKITTVLMSVVSIIFALILKKENVAWLVTLAFGIAASAIFPIMVSNLWWKRFTRQAAIAGMITGLVVSLFFIILLLSGVTSFLGFSTVGGPGIFGITMSIFVVVVVSYFTKDTGSDVEAFFALAHKVQHED
jgi:cation/acetate symporter